MNDKHETMSPPGDDFIERDWFNDPPFLRSVIFRTYDLLPEEVTDVFEYDEDEKDAVKELLGHVAWLSAVGRELDGDDDEDEEDEGPSAEDVLRNPMAGSDDEDEDEED